MVSSLQEHRPPARVGHTLGMRAVIADAYPLWLRAVETVLESLGVATIGTASTPADGIELIAELQPEILVTDLDFGGDGQEGADFVKDALAAHSSLKVVVLTTHRDLPTVEAAMAAGAAAYAVKSVRPDDLAAAIRQTFEHSIYLAPVNIPVAREIDRVEATTESPTTTSRPALPTLRRVEMREDAPRLLTKRENEILHLVADGLSNAEVARQLWVTEQTVKFHLSNSYRKLGVTNRTQASQWIHRYQALDGTAAAGD
jgi:DNA-binding NarL/FixJ family response regulator